MALCVRRREERALGGFAGRQVQPSPVGRPAARLPARGGKVQRAKMTNKERELFALETFSRLEFRLWRRRQRPAQAEAEPRQKRAGQSSANLIISLAPIEPSAALARRRKLNSQTQ